VHTNADSSLHQLAPYLAQMIAMFNSGAPAGMPGQAQGGRPAGAAGAGQGGAAFQRSSNGGAGQGQGAAAGGMGGGPGGGPGGGMGRGPRDFNQMLDRMPSFTLSELKPGEALIVVSTQGEKPSEVTAIVMLTGVEPILQARPKGSNEVVLGPWNMTMGGGGGEGGP
jgi:hypothetical protein